MPEYRPEPSSDETTSLPQISEGVLKRYLAAPPDFETLYKKLQDNDPRAAGWLLAVTERIAPANTAEKERYGKVALFLYGMLSDQLDINQLEEHLNMASEPTEETPLDEPLPPAA